MAFSQSDLEAIQAAQQANPDLSAAGINLYGVAGIETGGSSNPDTAISSTGATGLFQILPSTASSPGYGVQPVSAANLDNPQTNAGFAGSYLSGLVQYYEGQGETPGQAGQSAVNEYSGGQYTQSAVSTEAATLGMSGQNASVSSSSSLSVPVGRGGALSNLYNNETGTTSSIPIVGQLAGSASSAASWVAEIVERGGLILVGSMVLLVGLVFMFIDSKTITAHASALLAE